MADNVSITPGSGATVATRDLGDDGGMAGAQAQKTVVRGWPPTILGSDLNVSVSTSVVKSGSGLTIPTHTTHALVTVESGDVRFREDGAPTAANGLLLPAGTMIELPVPATATNLQFIESNTSGAAAVLQISYRQYI